MEYLGPNASGVSLSKAATKTVQAVSRLLHNIEQVPQELATLSQQLQAIHLLLETLQAIDSASTALHFPGAILTAPCHSLCPRQML